jgi:hypothetical protein
MDVIIRKLIFSLVFVYELFLNHNKFFLINTPEKGKWFRFFESERVKKMVGHASSATVL